MGREKCGKRREIKGFWQKRGTGEGEEKVFLKFIIMKKKKGKRGRGVSLGKRREREGKGRGRSLFFVKPEDGRKKPRRGGAERDQLTSKMKGATVSSKLSEHPSSLKVKGASSSLGKTITPSV